MAADASAELKAPGPSLSDTLAASGVTLNGYVDAAYSYLSGDGVFTSGVADRVFDTEPNSFNVHQAALIAAYQPKDGFGAYLNLTAGRDARVIKSFDTTTNDFDVTQAYVQYAHGPLTIIGGKYGLPPYIARYASSIRLLIEPSTASKTTSFVMPAARMRPAPCRTAA